MKSLFILIVLIFGTILYAENYYVSNIGHNGDGSFSSPFNNFSSALNTAQTGDTIFVFAGIYSLSSEISTVHNGTETQRIMMRAYNPEERPVLERTGRVFEFTNSYFTLDGFVIDGKFGDSDVFKVRSSADNTEIKNCEIKNGLRDGIDINAADNMLIENCKIHHFLAGSYSNPTDAHGIVATGEKNLTIRNCDIYYVSGDCFQTDPNRGLPLWDNVLIEDCRLWTGPLPESVVDWNQGEIPGENAIDTKVNPDSLSTGYRPKIRIKNTVSYGFESGFIANRAAFNIKEQVYCKFNAVKVYNNEIAFRLRGPGSRGGANVILTNCIAYNNEKMFRVEDGLELLQIYNCTFDKNSQNLYFENVSGGYDEDGFDVKNCLFMDELPENASNTSNMISTDTFFIDAFNHDYHLSPNSSAIDAGVEIEEVSFDYDGNPRKDGFFDIGAYEVINSTSLFRSSKKKNKGLKVNSYPNPFNSKTCITFDLDNSSHADLSIFNIVGQKVITLISGFLFNGKHVYYWSGSNSSGKDVGSGIYFCQLKTDKYIKMGKIILIR